jgi:protein CMS1
MQKSKKRSADGPALFKDGKRRKGKAKEDEMLDTELGLNKTFSRMDNQLLGDHLAQKTSRFGSDLSSVELSDLTVPGNQVFLNVHVRLRSC